MNVTARDVLISSLKGEFSDFEIIDINLSVSNAEAEVLTVPAVWICDMWAVHRTVDSIAEGWTLTHIPTGLAIHADSTLAAVLMALGAVIASDMPWDMVATAEDAKRMRDGLKDETQKLRKVFKTIFALGIPAETEEATA